MGLLTQFERHVGLSALKAAKLLGYACATYYQYRRTDVMPEYARRHVRALMSLPKVALETQIREYVFDDAL